jgi:hypothetical protein
LTFITDSGSARRRWLRDPSRSRLNAAKERGCGPANNSFNAAEARARLADYRRRAVVIMRDANETIGKSRPLISEIRE